MSADVVFRLRIYVAGEAQNSSTALANLHALCERHLVGRYSIDVVDVLHDPVRALDDGVLLTPALLKLAPGPVRKIVGTLSETAIVLRTLGLPAHDA